MKTSWIVVAMGAASLLGLAGGTYGPPVQVDQASAAVGKAPSGVQEQRAAEDLADRIRVVQRQLLELDESARIKVLQARGLKLVPRPPVNTLYNVEEFPPVAVRFVRFTILATTDGLHPCLDELEIYGPDGKENLARGKSVRATASSLLPDHPIHQVHHLHDGKYGNSWSWISNEPGKGWAQLELPAVAKVARIVWSRDAHEEPRYSDRLPAKYQIEVSTDGESWKTVASNEGRAAEDTPLPERDLVAALAPDQQKQRQELTTELKKLRTQAAEQAAQATEAHQRIEKLLHSVQAVIGNPAADSTAINFAALGGIPKFYPQHDAVLRELRALPHLQRLHLGWSGVTDAGLKEVRHLQALVELELESTQVGDAGVRELKALKGLQVLNLVNTQVTDADLNELPNLSSLNLVRTRITDEGLKHLKGNRSLRRLVLGNITDTTLKNLGEIGLLHTLYKVGSTQGNDQSIVSLDLSHTSTTASVLKGLELPGLRSLSLVHTPTSDADLEHLQGLKGLTSLDLSYTAVTSAGMKHFKGLKELRTLRLFRTQVAGARLKELVELPELETLMIGECPLVDEDLKVLPQMKKLRELGLQRSRLTDEGMKSVKDCKGLHTLYISLIDITDAGVKELKELPELRLLLLGATKVTIAGLKELKEAKSLKTLVLQGGAFKGNYLRGSLLPGNPPDRGHPVNLTGGQRTAIRSHGETGNPSPRRFAAGVELEQPTSRGGFPNAHHPIHAATKHELAIGRVRHTHYPATRR